MKKVNVADIIRITDGQLIIGDLEYICENFSNDTRKINAGDVYIGIKGENFDGNTLYTQAFENGASVCILENIKVSEADKEKYHDKTIIIVKDTIKTLGQIAAYKRSLYDIPVVAITGSVGKTSTKDIVANVISQKYRVLRTEENQNNGIGLPLTLLRLKDHEVIVVEMGMNHLGEISYLTHIAKPNIVIITNVGTSHIGNLGSRENILKAKLEILEAIDGNGTVIVNNDNELLNKWNKDNKRYRVITYGIDKESDLMPKNIRIQNNLSNYEIKINNKIYEVEVPISGRHFVYNSIAAIATGNILKLGMNDIIKGIKGFTLSKNRMNLDKIRDGIILINDAYNASYDSMKFALEYLKDFEAPRKIAVLGDMLELGEFSQELHEKVGEEVYKNNPDILITVGKYARYISKIVIKKGLKRDNVYVFDNNEEAKELLNNILKKDDIVLIKASNGMKFSEIVEGIKKEDTIS